MRKKRRSNLKIVLIIFFIILLWILFISKYSVIKILKNELEIAKKQAQIKDYKQKKEELIITKDNLENKNEMTIERKARELGMAKQGETIIRISDDEKNKIKDE
ncbi:MAG: septum formation initiator family protein [Candidatus Cloacimonetes bacterium]|nr:septum formation initiator family protein [Candidatus Cloacimonadota bacterium]MBL7085762.1 septum formation initiator family protein [Candidatus Cloacimonadota bacterium]